MLLTVHVKTSLLIAMFLCRVPLVLLVPQVSQDLVAHLDLKELLDLLGPRVRV